MHKDLIGTSHFVVSQKRRCETRYDRWAKHVKECTERLPPIERAAIDVTPRFIPVCVTFVPVYVAYGTTCFPLTGRRSTGEPLD